MWTRSENPICSSMGFAIFSTARRNRGAAIIRRGNGRADRKREGAGRKPGLGGNEGYDDVNPNRWGRLPPRDYISFSASIAPEARNNHSNAPVGYGQPANTRATRSSSALFASPSHQYQDRSSGRNQ